MRLKVNRKTLAAQDIALFELTHPDQQPLPGFTAGAHVCVMTPGGLLRRYSLCNPPSECDRYLIAVKRDAEGGGGSVSMVDELAAGDLLQVSLPENYFPLVEDAAHYLLIAGGIGITPILSMVHELRARNADFQLVYCSRMPETTAFLDQLSALDLAGRITVHHDHGDPARSLAIDRIIADQREGTHVYCCGPRGLMQGVRELTGEWPSSNVHFEDFGTSGHADAGGEKPFSVRLARTNVSFRVDPGVSILEAMRERGLEAPSSCESGTCGSCRTRLLSGVAEHRDFVLDDDEHDSQIMICVSRAQSDELVLDL
jgi:phthalate 4,5-dioxygenase reductase subunit